MDENNQNENEMQNEQPAAPEEHISAGNGNEINVPETDAKHYYSWDGEQFAKQKKKKSSRALIVILCVSLVLVGAAFLATLGTVIGSTLGTINEPQQSTGDTVSGTGGSVINRHESTGETSRQDYVSSGTVKTHSKSEAEEYTGYTELYKDVSDSCCTIYVPVSGGYYLGSGFVVDAENGYVVTNQHVVEGMQNKITAIFYDGREYDAELVGSDELTDIAVLKIEAEGLTALSLGDSNELEVGEEVIAVGTPYKQELAGTLTNGIITGVNRNIQVTGNSGKVVKTMTLIQTNSSINPGNSGGPLINMYGQVIGINTLKLMNEYEGLGFAIPISYAATVINNLIDYGEVVDDSGFVKATAKLNITVCTYSVHDADIAAQYNLPADVPDGVLITAITRDTAIYDAGANNYDIITEFGGVAVDDYTDLVKELAKYKAGDSVTMKVYRLGRGGTGGEYLTLSFVLEAAS